MDLAYTANGHVYHTNYDTPAAVTPGSIQRAGDNILALIKGIVNSPYLADPGEYRHGAVVFFDFLGVIMVHYPERISLVINVLTAFVVVLCLIRKFLGFPGKKDVKKGEKMFSTVSMCALSLTVKFRKLSEIQCIAGIVIAICCKPNQSLVGDIEGILRSSQIVLSLY